MSARPAGGASVGLVGLGNIGSQTAALLSGIEQLSRVLLIDPDRYEASNLGRQKVNSVDIGRPKVEAQANYLRKAAPHFVVETHALAVESVPLGRLRGCTILAGVDSRIARQAINRIAFALGSPWIDAALDRDGQVRARVYVPDAGPCLECAWGLQDYELLEQRVPCAGLEIATPTPQVTATAAPQELGAIAAGLQVSLLRRLLSREQNDAGIGGSQYFFDAACGRGWVGTYTVNADCRLDHAPWKISDLARSASDLTLHEALRLPGGDGRTSSLAIEGQMFVHRLHCVRCGDARRTAGRLASRMRPRPCDKCGAAMAASAADATDVLSARSVASRLLDIPLSAFGVIDGDIFTVRSQEIANHYQLCGNPQESH